MAKVDVGVSTDLGPENAWKLASDLQRFDEWLTIFGGWRSEVPSHRGRQPCVVLHQGQGFRNVIHWRVTRYDEPKLIEIVGGRPGVRIALTLWCGTQRRGRRSG